MSNTGADEELPRLQLPDETSGRESPSGSSIPSHHSGNYINSYYYGNVDMPDFTAGASSSVYPSASRSVSPNNSPLLAGNSNDERLIRRLSWGSRDADPPEQEQHQHQRNTSSSADVGLFQGPLDFQDTLPDRYPARLSSLPFDYTLPGPSVASLQPTLGGPGEEDDRAMLTAHQDGRRNVHYHFDDTTPIRSTSPDQIEEAQVYKSSADVYATAGHQPLDRARSGLQRLSKSIKRMSKRVVRPDSTLGHVPLQEQDDSTSDSSDTSHGHVDESAEEESPAELQLLRGKTLGLFGPESKLRNSLASMLAQWWMEPLILLLILTNTVTLIVQSAPSVYSHPRGHSHLSSVTDYILVAIFGVYTLEMLARIIVSGFVINPPSLYVATTEQEPKMPTAAPAEHRRKMSKSNTLDTFHLMGDQLKGKAQAILNAGHEFAPTHSVRSTDADTIKTHPNRRLNRTETSMLLSEAAAPSFWQTSKAPFVEAIKTQRTHTVHHAFLRHSWNRVDLIAVLAFWTAFGLSLAGQEETENHHIYIFRALSVLRCARLLTATSGTTTILESLKTAGPILASVSFFTAFALLLFSIIGIQSFKGSYRRSCVWMGDLNNQPGTNYTLSQICGAYIDTDGQLRSHIQTNGLPSPSSPKGFTCPRGQVCQEANENPENNTQSFDNIFDSLLQVVIVISSNSWSGTMYDMMDADYFASCLYFIIGLIVMNFWLANLFVAVITNSFATLTARTKRSAFADQKIEPLPTKEEQDTRGRRRLRHLAVGFKRVWSYTKYLWILAIIASVGFQASRATWLTREALEKRDKAELYFTIAFDFEIAMRFLAFVLDGDWRSFLSSKQNRADLVLAVVTSIIQIPVIQSSIVYPWLTFFQLARFYRVIAAIPRMRVLLVRAFGSLNKMLNMVLFLLLMVGLASLIASQLFRGDIPQENEDGEWTEMTFKHAFNSFLAMYQIFTSENWTDVLYSGISNDIQFKQAVIAGIFLGGWFLFANFIVLQMFIAVINENFSVAEGEKRQQQLEQYLRRNEPLQQTFTARLLNKMSPYRYLRARNAAKTGTAPSVSESGESKRANKIVGSGGANTLRRGDDTEKRARPLTIHSMVDTSTATAHRTVDAVRKLLRLDKPEEAVPMDNLQARHLRRSIRSEDLLRRGSTTAGPSVFDADPSDQAARQFADDRKLARMRTDLGLSADQQHVETTHRPHIPRSPSDARIQQARFIATHPSYDKSYFLFSSRNKFRRFCQSLVPSSYGERIFGRQVSPLRHKIFQVVIFLGIAGSVVSAAIATPVYRRSYYARFGLIRASWFSILELSLSSLFLAEFLIKTIADGLAFTPNAYVLSIWNSLDLFVLVTLIINVSTELAVIGGVSRLTRALKAFRALRLINLSSLMRDTFHAVMIAGAGRILDASILSILYIIPYAVWGQNLFAGLLYGCNDGSSGILTKRDCSGEFAASPGEWTFLVPRVWANPTTGSVYSFDDFKSSLLILFEIISLEGWIDVMTAAMSVTGRDNQLENDHRQINALFFLIYNLVGSTTVLTLFVSVIIENFQTFSGAAYQTAAQRQWIDLKKLILRQRPSKRPKVRPAHRLRSWCYDRTIYKHGWWSRWMTLCYVANIIVLMTQRYSDPIWADRLRDVIYLVLTLFYVTDIAIRLLGLGWRSYRENPWNLYDLFVVTGVLATTVPLLGNGVEQSTVVQFQKIFLTGVALKLVQKNHALNTLFKTALASLPAILSLFLLWLTMFLVWGIMLVEVFGLTKWGANETYSKNFSTLLNSLVFLSMMSTGEGWNSYMHDYTVSPPQCNPSANYLTTDCGSQPWAFVLFIGWNVLSMYIFLNMFTGTVVQNFSYIFESGGKVKLSREQIRHFKTAWARHDVDRKGYLQREQIVPFLGSVTGVLEVQLYPPQCSVRAIKQTVFTPPQQQEEQDAPVSPSGRTKGAFEYLRNVRSPLRETGHFMWPPRESEGQRLSRALAAVSSEEWHMRRERFHRIYHEAVLRMDSERGISFNEMLMLLARYTLVDEHEALDIEELIERRTMMEHVDHQVNLDRVRGLLKMVYWRRRYLALCEQKTKTEVPTILVHASTTLPKLVIPSTAKPSLEELELRASPQIESFESTIWGDVMKRVDQQRSTTPDQHSPIRTSSRGGY